VSVKELFRRWTYQLFSPGVLLREKYNAFKELLRLDNRCLERVAELEDIVDGPPRADFARVMRLCREMSLDAVALVEQLSSLCPGRWPDLADYVRKIDFYARLALDLPAPDIAPPYLLPLAEATDQLYRAGGKAANLAAVMKTGAPTPPGFVVAASAFSYFLESGDLRPQLDALLAEVDITRQDQLTELCKTMRALVLNAPMPAEIAMAVDQASLELSELMDGAALAVRSSAVGEDGRLSFAGQYLSRLDVAPADAVDAIRAVYASKYEPEAVVYRIAAGLADQETPMAVLVMPLLRGAASGVLHTQDPSAPEQGQAVIYAVPGLGAALAAGERTPETLRASREIAAQGGPLRMVSTLLRAEAAAKLLKVALNLERLFGGPIEMEWALDGQGSPQVLQARGLRVAPPVATPSRTAPELLDETPLLSGAEPAAGGAACGVLRRAKSAAEAVELATRFPNDKNEEGIVLLTPTLSPALARLVGSVSAVLSQRGSRAGHFASVAREFKLPVLVLGDGNADALPEGALVTVDADSGAVYAGRIQAILNRSSQGEPGFAPLKTKVGKVLPHVSRLSLTDPDSPDFIPAKMKSFHDVVRFSHEKGVAEMFSLVGRSGRGLAQAKRLKTDLPFALYVLDLGGGFTEMERSSKSVTPEQLASEPMRALWHGLAAGAATWANGMSSAIPALDFETFDQISAGIFAHDDKILASYGVVAHDYAHLMLRMGYHFAVVDAACGPGCALVRKGEDDCGGECGVAFRFKGGGGALDQRRLRVSFLAGVLGRLGFDLRVVGDMLEARLGHEARDTALKTMFALGRLMTAARFMDVALADEAQVEAAVESFLAGEPERA
jgi:pyruvate,water dikinase